MLKTAGIQAIPATVTPAVATCAPALSVTFGAASRTVDSGAEAKFTEPVKVAAGTAPGTYTGKTDFRINGASAGHVQDLTVVTPGRSIDDLRVAEVRARRTSRSR